MYVINIVDRIDKVNFGIWNAAIATAEILKNKYNISSQLWCPLHQIDPQEVIPSSIELVKINSLKILPTPPTDSIIVTHGCWRMPTRIGFQLRKMNYPWIYVPHGMLEPWGMKQKFFIKIPYFYLFEYPCSLNANCVRAVSVPEMSNLKKKYPQVVHIPNGSAIPNFKLHKNWNSSPYIFLFLGRLHKKKGIIPLIQAWKSSLLSQSYEYQLIIAGTDDGELPHVLNLIKNCSNIRYLGPIFGKEKEKLLLKAHFFILPSFSEGFPTSVIEAMQYGLIPIISEGCNFPEVFEKKMAFKVLPDSSNIREVLHNIIKHENFEKLSKECQTYANENYSLEHIAYLQYKCYTNLLK